MIPMNTTQNQHWFVIFNHNPASNFTYPAALPRPEIKGPNRPPPSAPARPAGRAPTMPAGRAPAAASGATVLSPFLNLMGDFLIPLIPAPSAPRRSNALSPFLGINFPILSPFLNPRSIRGDRFTLFLMASEIYVHGMGF